MLSKFLMVFHFMAKKSIKNNGMRIHVFGFQIKPLNSAFYVTKISNHLYFFFFTDSCKNTSSNLNMYTLGRTLFPNIFFQVHAQIWVLGNIHI